MRIRTLGRKGWRPNGQYVSMKRLRCFRSRFLGQFEQNPSLEPEFLFEQIELRENLDHLAEVKDLAGLVALLDGFASKLTAEAQQFGECFASGELDLATRSVYRMQFLNKLQSAAQQTEEALLDD